MTSETGYVAVTLITRNFAGILFANRRSQLANALKCTKHFSASVYRTLQEKIRVEHIKISLARRNFAQT